LINSYVCLVYIIYTKLSSTPGPFAKKPLAIYMWIKCQNNLVSADPGKFGSRVRENEQMCHFLAPFVALACYCRATLVA
jgi:hypothetical protein